jgi:SAM-dependent methyltransferase
MKQPGICDTGDYSERVLNEITGFIDEIKEPVADISPPNSKMEHIRKVHEFNVGYKYGMDYNFDNIRGSYRTIFCLEVLEHLQNPLFLMRELKMALGYNGIIYVSVPGRPKLLWPGYHYHEIPPKRLIKWIFKPLGLKVVKYKFIRTEMSFKSIGIRPLLRMILAPWNGHYIYKLKIDKDEK